MGKPSYPSNVRYCNAPGQPSAEGFWLKGPWAQAAAKTINVSGLPWRRKVFRGEVLNTTRILRLNGGYGERTGSPGVAQTG